MPTRRRRSTSTTAASSSRGTGRRRSSSPTASVIGATLDRNGLRPAKYVVTKRRARRPGERARRARRRSRARRREGAPAAGQDVPRRHRRRAHRLRRGDQARGRDAAAVPRVGRREQDRRSRRCPRRPARTSRAPTRCARCSGPSATRGGPARPARRRWRPAAKSRSGSMGIDIPLAVLERAAAAALPLLQAAVRAGDEPADRSDPRGARDVARELRRRRRQPARGDAGAVPHARAAASDPHERRPRAAARATSAATSAPARCAMRFPRAAERDRASARRGAAHGARSAVPRGASRAIDDGASILVLSDRGVDAEQRADPEPARGRRRCTTTSSARASACASASSSRPASRARSRTCALLIGFGAGAVNPYLAFETVAGRDERSALATAATNYVKALKKGLLKMMSKMGISALVELPGRADLRGHRHRSGGHRRLLHRHGVAHARHRARRDRRGGAGASRARVRRRAPPSASSTSAASTMWRATGERAPLDAADASPRCRRRCASRTPTSYEEYARLINEQARAPDDAARAVGPPAGRARRCRSKRSSRRASIVQRFATGAMSFGASRRRRTRTSPSR